ncbi:MAG: F0F1 ATP synthase subunit B [Clostridiales bacterium]|nr:F0F1 ATP synthase subunit B [Clostridiales bacterium]
MINMYSTMLLAAEASSESGLFSADQMGGYAATILITIINVAVAYIIIRLFIFKPILNVIKKREAKIASDLDAASRSKEEAASNAEVSKQAIDDAHAQASQILEETKADAEEQAKIIRMKAKEEADEIIDRANNEVIRMKKVAIEEMKDEISDLAVEVAGRVIGDVVEHDKLKDLANKHTEELIGEEVDKLEQ